MAHPSAAVAASAPVVSSPAAEQHTLSRSIFLHLIPGVIVTLVYALLVPPLLRAGIPNLLTLNLVAILVLVPVEMGILFTEGKRQTGRYTLRGIVLNRERLPLGQLLLWALVAFLWAGLAFTFVSKVDGVVQRTLFGWLPSWFPLSADFTNVSREMAILTLIASLICTSWIAPYVEELYFRGYLLPRLSRFGIWAVLLNACLFVLYHFFTPWQAVTRIVAVLPLVYFVQRKRNLYISVIAHLALNTVSLLPTLIRIMSR